MPQAGVGVGGQAKTIVIAAPRGQTVAGSPRIVALPASAAGVVTQQGGPRKVVIVGARPSANGQPRVSAVPGNLLYIYIYISHHNEEFCLLL